MRALRVIFCALCALFLPDGGDGRMAVWWKGHCVVETSVVLLFNYIEKNEKTKSKTMLTLGEWAVCR